MLRTVHALGRFATVTERLPGSTQAGSFQVSVQAAIGKRIHVQAFHHARRLWLKSNTAFAVRLSTNSDVHRCKFLLVAGLVEDKARLAVLSCEECGAAHSNR